MRINWREPNFWRKDHLSYIHPARLLYPLAYLLSLNTQRRIHRQKEISTDIPIICCGGLTVGGAGKTTLAISLASYLKSQGFKPAFITHGYKATVSLNKAYKIQEVDTAEQVGDEPKLLSSYFPCWIGKNRKKSALAAIENGADCLILDDGLQNSTLRPSLNILAINGEQGIGNGLLNPIGPLRETITQVSPRVDRVVFFGEDKFNLIPKLEKDFTVFKAELIPEEIPISLKEKPIVAFAGLNQPSKFFNMIQKFGVKTKKNISFPNHHSYSAQELTEIQKRNPKAVLICTPKDYIKIPIKLKNSITVIKPKLQWENSKAPQLLLEGIYSHEED